MEYMFFNQTGGISTPNGSSLKLVDKFTYLGSSVSSTKTDINTQLAKAWRALDRLSVIWKSDLTAKIKRSFSQAPVVSILVYGCTTWTLTKRMRKSLTATSQECCEQYWTSPGGSIYNPSWKLSKLDEPDMRDTAEEVETSSSEMYSDGPLHMDEQKQDDQPKTMYSSFVLIQDVALKTCQKQWTIGRNGERGSGISVLMARHDEDDDVVIKECADRWTCGDSVKLYHKLEYTCQ